MDIKMVLASASPRRREILENLGFDIEIITTNAEEGVDISGMAPEVAVQELALVKGRSVAQKLRNDGDKRYLVVSADTVVVIDGEILGKPKNREEAGCMLKNLSGRRHSVMTGIAIWKVNGGSTAGKGCAVCEVTDVYFKELSDDMIEAYLDTREYRDKAGSYGIQGKGAYLVDRIEGDYFNVVGFPINKFYELLAEEHRVDIFYPGLSSLWIQREGVRYVYKKTE